MCGIAGCAGVEPEAARERVEAMLACLVHRGPDAAGLRSGPGWVLGARRLAIVDLVTGDQPVTDESGSIAAVCNGEIYNYRELRAGLHARGHNLRSVGDTEVLVHLWEERGHEMLGDLRGMFALALMDARSNELFLARDRLGKKPLYFARQGHGIAFASELKALRKALPESPSLDPDAVAEFLRHGFVPEGRCILHGVEKLPPGHWLRLDLATGEIELHPFWTLALEADRSLSFREARRGLMEVLGESVRLRLRSDVPLGVFLSGGLDSGAVTAVAARETPGLRAINVSFGGGDDELPLARATAAHAGAELTSIEVRAEEGFAMLPKMAEVFDEPLADPSCIPTYLVAREARKLVTVVLTGDGGDEALAGYRRFLAARLATLPGARVWGPVAASTLPGLPADWRARLGSALRTRDDPYLELGPAKFAPEQVRALLAASPLAAGVKDGPPGGLAPSVTVREERGEPVNRMRAHELGFFLPGDLLVKMDRATMSNSLEARSPFLDHRLIEFAAKLPPALLLRAWSTKAVLRGATRGLLPEVVRRAPKRGFEIPLADWLAGPWAGEVRAVLESGDAAIRRFIPVSETEPLATWAGARDRGRAARCVYTLLTLEHWLRRWG